MKAMFANGKALATAAVAAVLLAGCSSSGENAAEPDATPTASASATAAAQAEQLSVRMVEINAAIVQWQSAGTIDDARKAAETVLNLIVGPAGPLYGDANGDGAIEGQTAIGLLPGLEGQPGLIGPDPNPCTVKNVLGTEWTDPRGEWAKMTNAIDAWAPNNNTFPNLVSQPQRIAGWAALALKTDDLATAREYAGKAQVNSEETVNALFNCTVDAKGDAV